MDLIKTIVQQAQKNEKEEENILVQKKFFFHLLTARDDDHRFFLKKVMIAFSMSVLILGVVTILYVQSKIESAEMSMARVATNTPIPFAPEEEKT